jgi:DNA invertase Pin-like site-specific DNA recombinase
MNIVIYTRYGQRHPAGTSIEQQLLSCREFAKSEGFTVIGEYTDINSSGMSDNRPAFQRMIADSANKQFQCVLVYRLDRFSRSRHHNVIYKSKLKENGVRVISVLENLPDNAHGALMEAILESMAEWYSADLSRKIKAGIRAKKAQKERGGDT